MYNTYHYRCTLCEKVFPGRQEWRVHAAKCSDKHEQKASYKILPVKPFTLNSDTPEGQIVSNRFQNNVREWIYKYLAVRDGEKCLLCGALPGADPLEIDHSDANPLNNAPDNLHLLCKKCNLSLRKVTPKEHLEMISIHSANNVRERERTHGNPATELAQTLIDYNSGSVPMQAAKYFEVRFRQWVLDQVNRLGMIPKQDAVNSGAEVIGCSIQSIERYLVKLTSSAGALQVINSGNQILLMRREVKRRPNPALSLTDFNLDAPLSEILK